VQGGNTSNLLSHLQDKHPALYKEANQGKTAASVVTSSGAATSRAVVTLPRGTNLIHLTVQGPRI